MPDTPIHLNTPRTCQQCGLTGKVELQHVMEQERIVLEWACKNCGHTWLVRHRDEHPQSAQLIRAVIRVRTRDT
jgi:hypothetical protein